MKIAFLSITCLINLLIISLSLAEEKSGSQTSNKILTQSELSQCNEKTKTLNKRADELIARSTQLKTQKDTIRKLKQDRKQKYINLDLHSKNSVDEYNQVNEQLKQLSQAYKADVQNFNNTVKQYKADVGHHKSQCDNKQYYK